MPSSTPSKVLRVLHTRRARTKRSAMMYQIGTIQQASTTVLQKHESSQQHRCKGAAYGHGHQ
jgi:hypothetical protein